MFFFKKNLIETQLFSEFTDYHSHILPGVDDGAKSVAESLEILSWYEELGVKRVTLTPHIMEDMPLNNATRLREEFYRLRNIYNGDIELTLAAEYMLDSKFKTHLDSDDILTFDGNFLLIECSYAAAPINLFETIDDIMRRGYFVTLAHPERYLFLTMDDYRRLKDMGVLFQLNILSVLGGYGREVTKRAERLLDLSYYNFCGSDIHNIRVHRKLLSCVKLRKKVIAQLQKLTAELL